MGVLGHVLEIFNVASIMGEYRLIKKTVFIRLQRDGQMYLTCVPWTIVSELERYCNKRSTCLILERR